MVRYIIDTYAWIEYLNGSARGEILRKLFNDYDNKFITMECCICELKGFCLKKGIDFSGVFKLVSKNSFIFPVLLDLWVSAAEIKSEMRKKIKDFGIIDAVLLAKQKELDSVIITGDKHFKGLKNVKYIGD